MKRTWKVRMLSFVLAVAIVWGWMIPAQAAGEEGIHFYQTDNSAVSVAPAEERQDASLRQMEYGDADLVRVSIVLEEKSTLEAGFATAGMAENLKAMTYREQLRSKQEDTVLRLSQVTGAPLDVEWNLTLAANIISANVPYGKLETIRHQSGVKAVVLETRYEPQAAQAETVQPNMAVSVGMTGTNAAWMSGYTGAGMRIAVIDTGTDTDHQSLDAASYHAALEENAERRGQDLDRYLDSLNLLNQAELDTVLPRLNAAERRADLSASDLYLNEKLPFGFCYVDGDLDITHDNDDQGAHGSHVAGIACAKRLLPEGEGFAPAIETIGVVGTAPDAQLLTMKVFGNQGGAYDSDYMAAIEDAILLNCQVINLSLGSAAAGMTTNPLYQELLDALADTDTVVCASAGNSGRWGQEVYMGHLYTDDVSYYTGGSPSSYTNMLSVASVDNDGMIGNFFSAGGERLLYNETRYTNDPLTSLDTSSDHSGTSYPFLLLDESGEEWSWMGLEEQVKGKIVLVRRGDLDFSQKAEIAAKMGAVACIVYNNQDGSFNMDLTGYTQTMPCVSITRDAAKQLRAVAKEGTSPYDVIYYTGDLTVYGSIEIVQNHSETYTMSDFSSWGVPGDLSLKPEITAPGGGIYSINGAVSQQNQYERMSGTSMASPHVAGIAGLVQERIRSDGISQAWLTDRAMAQSLMMSTAVPLRDREGNYYPVIQQGAGLVDAAAAVEADSFVLVDGQPDGKVKAELGDDPERLGAYSFGFTLTNLSQEEKTFGLWADAFAQNTFDFSYDGVMHYIDTKTMPLDASITWTADGLPVYREGILEGCDFNGDGMVDSLDGEALLDYVTRQEASIQNLENADLNGDGRVDTYDVHLFLARLGRDTVTVPGGGSVKVTATIALTEEQKETLEAIYPNGTMIQAYVYAGETATAEGVQGTTHSIPVLAFYGNWTDASMFDVSTFETTFTHEENRPPYVDNVVSNAVGVVYGDQPGSVYNFGGNTIVADAHYKPERNAINAQRGDRMDSWLFTCIRNAADSRYEIFNPDTGEVYREGTLGSISAAYYDANYQTWRQSQYELKLKWAPKDLNEGDRFEMRLTLAPELYVKDGQTDWDALGDGATLTMPVTVDNTAPVLEDVSYSATDHVLRVTASDNQYLAGVRLFNLDGSILLAEAGTVEDAQAGETRAFDLDLTYVNGRKFLVQVYDYAWNRVTYQLELQIGQQQPVPEIIGYLNSFYGSGWHGFGWEDSFWSASTLSTPKEQFLAAADVDGMMFASTDRGALYVYQEDDLYDRTFVANMDVIPEDMAYDAAGQQLYAVADGQLVCIDKCMGTTRTVGAIGVPTNTLACDGQGNFYCVALGAEEETANRGFVYRFTLDTLETPEAVTASNINNNSHQALEWSANAGKLFFASVHTYTNDWGMENADCYTWEIDPATGEVKEQSYFNAQIAALCIPTRQSADWAKPVDTVEAVQLSHTTLELIRGSSATITASVLPWTVSNRDIHWSSSDETVATVDGDGVITAVAPGQAVVTAASALDPSVTASCTVTVRTLQTVLHGVMQNSEGTPSFFQWDLEEDETWTAGEALDTNLVSAVHDPVQNALYVMDSQQEVWAMHKIDMATGKTIGEPAANGLKVPLWDMAYSTVFSTQDAPKVAGVYGSYFVVPQDPMKLNTSVFQLEELMDYLGSEAFVGVASAGYAQYQDQSGELRDSERFLLLDDKGFIWNLWVYETEGGFAAEAAYSQSDLAQYGVLFPEDETGFYKYSSLVLGGDGALYLSAFTGDTNELYRLTFQEEENLYNARLLGSMGDGVWPAALYQAQDKDGQTMGTGLPNCQEPAFTVTMEQQPGGSLQSVEQGEAKKSEDQQTLDLTAKVSTTNGLYEIIYRPDELTLVSFGSTLRCSSFAVEEGKVRFGYANDTALPSDTVLGTLTFTSKNGLPSDVKLVRLEQNQTQERVEETVTISCGCPSAPFRDVTQDAWYHEGIDFAVSHGLMKGVSPDMFQPNGSMTRAQMVTVLYRLAGAPEVEGTVPFTDVQTDQYYSDALIWAYGNGITKGITGQRFAPNAPVTREQMAAFFARYAQYEGKTVAAKGNLDDYGDGETVRTYAKESMIWAVEAGLICGMPGKLLYPGTAATRAQAAQILMRYCHFIQSAEYEI